MAHILIVLFLLTLCPLHADCDCAQKGSPMEARWISRDAIVWEKTSLDQAHSYQYRLYADPTQKICLVRGQIVQSSAGQSFALPITGLVGDGKDSEFTKKLAYFSFLKGRLRLGTQELLWQIPELIQGDLVITKERDGKVVKATRLQLAGLLDDLFFFPGELGVVWENNKGYLRVWAPTAQKVSLRLFDDAKTSEFELLPMERLPETGVWQREMQQGWEEKFYQYQVTVFVPGQGLSENVATDPYSVSLSKNSERSQIINLSDPRWFPTGWGENRPASLLAPEDMAIYELHLRDFSRFDPAVPDQDKGCFSAFTHKNSHGMRHLSELAEAGLTHLHLLPLFDIATIEEDRALQKTPKIPAKAGPASKLPQQAVNEVKDQDAYNWGYDPYHYGVPEGSYSTEPNGPTRILEMRQMVQSLNEIGLQVIMDVVYNHTHAAGIHGRSVFDKIVPTYYYRLNDQGYVQSTTCCPDTASEHKMMEKLMIDTLKRWAIDYHIAGFRFDLMGHHTRENMIKVRKSLQQLTLEKDGCDGSNIYVYGEGWKFGSLDAMLPDQAFHQANTFGAGVGSFNDRIRDSVRGGSPFSDLPAQGFATGLYLDFNYDPDNNEIPFDLAKQKEILLNLTDNIRLGMAGNLRDFEFINAKGQKVKGKDIHYRGNPGAGYCQDPEEIINYISIHDNHTLWDCIQAKAPFHASQRANPCATVAERVAMQKLAISLIALGQGIPCFHAGVDMLRSKSGDADSYNSGDWFNRLDFTYQENNWGVGLPPYEKNHQDWDFWHKRLENLQIKPHSEHIRSCSAFFKKMLAIRRSSPLFRLRTAGEIQQKVRFLNAEQGKKQIPGVIAMYISDSGKNQVDPQHAGVLCLFNAAPDEVTFSHSDLDNKNWQLDSHCEKAPITSSQVSDKNFQLPARSVLVYWQK